MQDSEHFSDDLNILLCSRQLRISRAEFIKATEQIAGSDAHYLQFEGLTSLSSVPVAQEVQCFNNFI